MYRDQVKIWKDTEMSDVRQEANDAAALHTTNTIYIPVALALSERFSKEVGYVLHQA